MAGHSHKESFVSKYVFSMDHKMISKQFLITAIFMGIVAVLLSLLCSVCSLDGQENPLHSSTDFWAIAGRLKGYSNQKHTWRW